MAIGISQFMGNQSYYDASTDQYLRSRYEIEEFKRQHIEMLRQQERALITNPSVVDAPKKEKSNPVLLLLEI